jgi:LysR family glycine cleavage system transcriptional activator
VPHAPRLPLNTLTAFRAVAELQNLRAAADVLHLTHSAVSQQIRGLEEQLGFALFDRRGRRVVLNAAGQALLRSVQSALALLDDGVQAAAAASTGDAQRLRVTVLPSLANRWLLPRISRWRDRHPALAVGTRNQALADDPFQRAGELGDDLRLLVRREDIDDAVDRLRGIGSVQGGENEVAGFRSG